MTDIRLPLGGVNFSVRVAVLCVRDDQLLTNTGVDERGQAFWFPLGGALSTGQDTLRSATREWVEETGWPAGPLSLAGLAESLFVKDGVQNHELAFYFQMDPPAQFPQEPFGVLDDPRFVCEWLSLGALGSRPRLERQVRAMLAVQPATLAHVVQREADLGKFPAPSDVLLKLGGLNFSVRVAILCTWGKYLLTNTSRGLGFDFLPGGALSTGETTLECARREWLEETGVQPGPLRLVGIIENFFGPPEKPQHELGFYYRMEAPDELPGEPFALKDRGDTTCQWVPLAEVAQAPVYPLAALTLLDVPDGTIKHIVNRE